MSENLKCNLIILLYFGGIISMTWQWIVYVAGFLVVGWTFILGGFLLIRWAWHFDWLKWMEK